MDAGRELDAEIHERVMGQKVVARDWPCGRDPECGYYSASMFLPPVGGWYSEPGPVSVAEGGRWPPARMRKPLVPGQKAADVEAVPFYSTELEAAWDVVEKIRTVWQERVRISVTTTLEGYDCDIIALTGHGRIGWADAPTAPHAICLAAIKSVTP